MNDLINKSKNHLDWNEKTKEALVSNKNIVLYYYFLKNYFRKNNQIVDVSEELFEDRAEKAFFLDKDNWCTLEEYVGLVEKAIKITGNHELPKIVGSMLANYRKELKLQEFLEATIHHIKAFFLGPVEIFRQLSSFNQLFNLTKDMYFVNGGNGHCLIVHKFKEDIEPVYDYVSEMFIEGIFISIIDLFSLEEGIVDTYLKQYDLKLLLEKKFFPKSVIKIDGDFLYMDNVLIAEKTKIKENNFLKNNSSLSQNKLFGWKIKENIYLDDKYLVIKKNDIYNAPFFATEIKWKKISILRGMSSLLKGKFSEFSPLKNNYAKLMQNRIQEEQNKTRILAERKKLEKEVYQLLERNYINDRFIRKARRGPIPFRSISVTNIFMDLHNSSELRKKIGEENYRTGMNNVLRLIRKNLKYYGEDWAWLNKVIGDGCYIVFGTYNYFSQKQDKNHIFQAIDFCKKLLLDIKHLALSTDKNYNSSLMKEFEFRFGLEFGKVQIGESHEDDYQKEEDKIDFGSLRVFDTDGISVHIAKRVEEISKLIILKKGYKDKSGIFLGPDIASELNKRKEYTLEKVILKDCGLSLQGFREIDSVFILK